MDIFMIAVIQNPDGTTAGYRLLQIDGKNASTVDTPATTVKQVLLSGKAIIKNMGLDGSGELVGTNGVISRYPQLNISRKLMAAGSPLIIINQVGDAGYTVSSYTGEMKKVPSASVISYGQTYGIANGKIVSKNNIDYVSSITGEYDIVSVPKARAGARTDRSTIGKTVGISIPTTSNGSIARNTGVDVMNRIDENDVFKAMTVEQKQILKSYYTWYTLRVYKSLSKDIRLKVADSKVENLAHLRGIKEWQFAGVWDTGMMGGSHCELGHALRYEYYAAPKETCHDTSTFIVFGSRCASDFFEISVENMKNLEKAANIMSDEVAIMSDILSNKLEDEYYAKIELMYDIIKKLETRANVEAVFGKELASYMIAFIGSGMPLMQSLVKLATKEISKDISKFYETTFPEYGDTIRNILETTEKPNIFCEGYREYLKFVATNKIEGEYAYDPLSDDRSHKDEGRYNKEARALRSRLLWKMRGYAFCTKFNYDSLVESLDTVHALKGMRMKFIDEADRTIGHNDRLYLFNMLQEMAYSVLAKGEDSRRNAMMGLLAAFKTNPLIALNGNRIDIPSQMGGRLSTASCRSMADLKRLTEIPSSDIAEVTKYIFDTFLQKRKEKEDAEAARIAAKETYDQERRRREDERAAQEKADRDARRARLEQEEADNRAEQEQAAQRLKEVAAQKARDAQETLKSNTTSTAATKNEYEIDKVKEAAALIQMAPHDGDYGATIVLDIASRGVTYSDCTYRQRYWIDRMFTKYSTDAIQQEQSKDETEVAKADINAKHKLSDNPTIKSKVDFLVARADTAPMAAVLETSPNIIKICYTILATGVASDRQMKHIDKAYEALRAQ